MGGGRGPGVLKKIFAEIEKTILGGTILLI